MPQSSLISFLLAASLKVYRQYIIYNSSICVFTQHLKYFSQFSVSVCLILAVISCDYNIPNFIHMKLSLRNMVTILQLLSGKTKVLIAIKSRSFKYCVDFNSQIIGRSLLLLSQHKIINESVALTTGTSFILSGLF